MVQCKSCISLELVDELCARVVPLVYELALAQQVKQTVLVVEVRLGSVEQVYVSSCIQNQGC